MRSSVVVSVPCSLLFFNSVVKSSHSSSTSDTPWVFQVVGKITVEQITLGSFLSVTDPPKPIANARGSFLITPLGHLILPHHPFPAAHCRHLERHSQSEMMEIQTPDVLSIFLHHYWLCRCLTLCVTGWDTTREVESSFLASLALSDYLCLVFYTLSVCLQLPTYVGAWPSSFCHMLPFYSWLGYGFHYWSRTVLGRFFIFFWVWYVAFDHGFVEGPSFDCHFLSYFFCS